MKMRDHRIRGRGSRGWVCPLLFLAFVLLSGSALYAQTMQGDIIGTIRDPQGNVVPGAQIRIINQTTGATRVLKSNAQGSYHGVGFFVGTYRVEAEKAGFQQAVVTGVKVDPVTVKRVDLTLRLGSVKQVVTVTGGAPVIQTESATINVNQPSVLFNKPIENISRSGWGFAALTWAPGSSAAAAAPWVFGGATGSQTLIEVEGVQEENRLTFIPPYSIAELSLISGVPPAEYGSSVVANATFKSGSNTLHGSWITDLHNPGVDAQNSPFSRPHPAAPGFPQWRQEFNIGGPVFIPKIYDGRDKTFFFFDMHLPRGSTTSVPVTTNLPTKAMQAGNFQNFPIKPNDPLTGQSFPNNMIPSDRISPVAQKIMSDYYSQFNYVGDPNSFVSNATFPGGFFSKEHRFMMKFDENIGTKNFFTFTYEHQARIGAQDLEVSAIPSGYTSNFPTYQENVLPQWRWSFAYTRSFSPVLTNQLRLGAFRSINGTHRVVNTNDLTPMLGADVLSSWGIQGVPATGCDGVPHIAIVNWSYTAGGECSNDTATQYQFNDDLSWVKGRHSLKFGGMGLKTLDDNPFSAGFGNFTFDGRFTGEPFADFLLGLPGSFSRTFPRPAIARRIWEYAFYAQDKFHVTPKLDLSYGVRWERYTAPYDKNGEYFNFDLATGQIVVPDQKALNSVSPLWPSAQIPVVLANTLGYPSKLTNPISRFLPRFGFAYRPTGKGSLVIRGGYGIYNGVVQFANLQTGGPFAVTQAYLNAAAAGTSTGTQYSWPNAFAGPAASATGVSTGASVDKNITDEYTQTWTLSAEQQFLKTWGVRVSYIGNKTTQYPYQFNANTPLLSTEPFSQDRRPYPAFQNITRIENGANAHYDALQILLHHPFRNGLYLEVSYMEQRAYSDTGDTANGFQWAQGSAPVATLDYAYNRARDYGRNGLWPSHDFVINYAYDLPFGLNRRWLSGGGGAARALQFFFGGWSATGFFNWHSGRIFTPFYSGLDPGNIGQFSGRPDVVPGCQVYTGLPLGAGVPYFNQSCFTIPANGTLGNAKIGSLEGPGQWVWTLSPWKEFHIPHWETATVQIGANIWNILNHPVYGQPSGIVNSPSGAYLSGSAIRGDTEFGGHGREFVWSAKFMF